MAVMVVVLVLAMLTAVAVFAARSAVGNTANAGRYRQLTQTHTLSEMATIVAIGEVGRNPQVYSDRIESTPAPASGQIPCKLANSRRQQCAQLGYEALTELYRVADSNPSLELVDPKAAANAPSTLGLSDTRADFFVELTDNTVTPVPPLGYSATESLTSGMHFRRITVLAGASVIPDAADFSTVSASGRFASTLETTRAYVLVGPVQ
jgi:hypothetical protein